MEFTTVLDSRKSIRSFTGEAISQEALKKLLHAANSSPVGLGKYDSVHLTVIKDKELLEEIDKNAATVFKAGDRSFLYHAPELILISSASNDNLGHSNAAIIAQSILLAAVEEGVGACPIWSVVTALSANPELVAKLNLPEGFLPSCSVVIGKTEETYEPREIPEERIAVNYI